MNLPINNFVIEGNMGEDKTSPTMLSLEQQYRSIQIKQEQIYCKLYQYNYITKQKVSTESFVFKDLVSKTIGIEEISNESAKETLTKIWSYLKNSLNDLRQEIIKYFLKVSSQVNIIESDWDKVKRDFEKLRRAGKLAEVSSKEINKDWFSLALDKGKLSYIDFDLNGNIKINEKNRYNSLQIDMEGFITKTFKLINNAYRENNYLSISSPLSNLFSETFILFDKIKHRTNDILLREVYNIAEFGSNRLFVPVIPVYDRTSAEYINEFRPIQDKQSSQFHEGITNVPVCQFKQFDEIDLLIKDLKQVVNISFKNYKRVSNILTKEDKQFTDIVVSAPDSRIETVEHLQKIITFLNRISTLELEYCRILLRSGHDLVYFAKCALLVMKNYGEQFNS